MTKQERIERLKAKITDMEKKLQFAAGWPLHTSYWNRVEKTYPEKIASLYEELSKLEAK